MMQKILRVFAVALFLTAAGLVAQIISSGFAFYSGDDFDMEISPGRAVAANFAVCNGGEMISLTAFMRSSCPYPQNTILGANANAFEPASVLQGDAREQGVIADRLINHAWGYVACNGNKYADHYPDPVDPACF